jgi:hypothetical protein
MNWTDLATGAGTLATLLFVLAIMPMLLKAGRSQDLRSDSGAKLAIANCGNLLQSLYIASLPAGPIWGTHLFNTIASLLMLRWWLRFRRQHQQTTACHGRPLLPARTRHAEPTIPPADTCRSR